MRVGGNKVAGAKVPVPDEPGGDPRPRGMTAGGPLFGETPAQNPAYRPAPALQCDKEINFLAAEAGDLR